MAGSCIVMYIVAVETHLRKKKGMKRFSDIENKDHIINVDECFYGMIRHWILSDYNTQGIKAEVIIDMLLSEFLPEIIASGLKANNVKVGASGLILLMKEFPILKNGQTGMQNYKVDFLLCDPEKRILYLTELKTSNNSFREHQIQVMNEAICRASDQQQNPINLFLNLLEQKILNSRTYRRRDTGKYLHSLLQWLQELTEWENLKKGLIEDRCFINGALRFDEIQAVNERKAAWRRIKSAFMKEYLTDQEYKYKIVCLTVQPLKIIQNDMSASGVYFVSILDDFNSDMSIYEHENSIRGVLLKKTLKIIKDMAPSDKQYVD